jgi:hypothetical protein
VNLLIQIQNAILAAWVVLIKALTFSQSLSKENCIPEIVGVLMAMDLDSAWPMEHLLRSLSIPEVYFSSAVRYWRIIRWISFNHSYGQLF